ncbi:TadE/TadG family type IV pilus assembly protein [Sphingomonas tabacisoli]|uniref:TadE/TadG family type IV pilus assembly protein n=1 Tax=Sphingomonas tabacisoli TaxID=2249466 RepID=A0ABW4I657_9SPHN
MHLTSTKAVAAIDVLKRFGRNRSGLALIEFAYAMPAVMGMGMYGVETANLAQTHMRVSQIALMLADNASRAGVDVSGGTIQQLREIDINDVMQGLRLQAADLNLTQNGRVTLSSLETNVDGGQWIHWQRCVGLKNGAGWDSSYGVAGQGATGTALQGMGPTGAQVKAPAGEAVIFVEINYQYKSLFGNLTALIGTPVIKYTASYIVRDKRDLAGNGGTGIYDPSPAVGAAKMTCDKYTA